MPRPSNADQQRRDLLPLIAAAFAQSGYRRATTAGLAAACGVRENILYRLWSDKKAMFLAAIQFLFGRRMEQWSEALAEAGRAGSQATRLIELTARDLGEQGLYRIIFSALSETDDDDIKRALQGLYRRYHERVRTEVSEYRERFRSRQTAPDEDTAWGLIALVAFMNMAVDLELMSARKRQRFFTTMAAFLLNGEQPS